MIDLNSQIDLHRLATGDVSIDEENDAIIQCETNPVLYRKVALAFIEERQFRESMATFADTDSNLRTSTNWRGWLDASKPVFLAACLLITVVSSVFAIRSSQRDESGEAFSRTEPLNGKPIVVQVVYPENDRRIDQLAAKQVDSLSRPIFNQQARELLRDAGFVIEEEFKLHVVNDPLGEQRAYPDRRVRLQYVNQ